MRLFPFYNAPSALTVLLVSMLVSLALPQPSAWPQEQASPAAQQPEQQQFSSVEQRRLKAEIAAERKALTDEKKALELRENELKTLEATVDKKLAELDKKLAKLASDKKAFEDILAGKDAEEQKKIQELSKIYDRMDPNKAALALSGLDEKLAADILAQMKVKAAAKVLDSLNKQKAAELSKTFSTIQIE